MKKLNKAVNEFIYWKIQGYNPKIVWIDNNYIVTLITPSMMREKVEIII